MTAASPGALAASGAQLEAGVLFNQFHEATAQDVAVLGKTAAAQLGISSLVNEPAIFIGGQPFTVVGILCRRPAAAAAQSGRDGTREHRTAAVGPSRRRTTRRRC